MNTERINALIKLGGLKTTNAFLPYTSGQIGPYYVQGLAVTKDGEEYKKAITSLRDLVLIETSGNFDVVSGGESRDWDFSNPIAVALEKPHLKLYKDGGHFGTDVMGKRVIHVADMNNRGYSINNFWAPKIRKLGGKVKQVFFYVDRMEEGRDSLKNQGPIPNAVIELDEEVWEYLRENENWTGINDEIYENIKRYRCNKQKWAIDMLRSERGFTELKKFLKSDNPRLNKKAEKILEKGYPELKEELTERLQTP